jgi:tRNA (guanine-N7-)-methyltransferase
MMEDNERERGSRGIKSYQLRSGRMTDAQKAAYEESGHPARIDASKPGFIDAEGIFLRRAPLIVEIGFGMGQATIEIAQRRPDTDFIGIEVHKPGIGRLLCLIRDRGVKNLKVLEGDASELLELRFREESLAGIHLFFPDPWPKKRHAKRRIARPPFIALASSRLVPGGYFHMATDWAEYAEEARLYLDAEPSLEACHAPQHQRPLTKFEAKALSEGRSIRELYYTKRHR